MTLVSGQAAKLLVQPEPTCAVPVLKSITVTAEAAASLSDGLLVFNYGDRRIRYRITRQEPNIASGEVVLYLCMDRVLGKYEQLQ